ncbi:hypothetical protein DUNSADRAFT_13098 [Dunaliella salina]|uniref:beta-N-acetylhexosaminidase n=1 Tax=Dunaliella salina TaxID=3046 RepID=A0ABQ7GA57_DUNSA|nr:hypothetical protein DUNSADRAFT_13098 [Dunaliella salina]|eukprot:KAF5831476.1 hypothetical protein DUNSADRAFT_13098 [Dunaliella salina]
MVRKQVPELPPSVVFPPPPEGIRPVTDVIGVTPGAVAEERAADVMVLDPGAALEEANVVVREGANFSLASNHSISITSSRAASLGAAPVGMAVDDVLAGGGAEQYKEGPLSRPGVGRGSGSSSRGEKVSGTNSVVAAAAAGNKGVNPVPLTSNLAQLELQQQQQREREQQEEAEELLMQREQMEHLLQAGAVAAAGGPLPPPPAPLPPPMDAVHTLATSSGVVVQELGEGVVLEGGVEPLVPPVPPVVPPPIPLAPGVLGGGGIGLTPEERSLIMGAQGNLWTEFVPDEPTAWYMMLPRLPAMAEAIWRQPGAQIAASPAAAAAAAVLGKAPPPGATPQAGSWESFLCRVRDAHAPQWDASGIPNCPVDTEGVF